jgi:hypothetical protein
MRKFENRKEAWEWAELETNGNCSVLVKVGDNLAIFEYLADDFGLLKWKGYR